MTDEQASKRGRASRRRGHNFERRIAEEFRHFFPEARRQLEYHVDDCKGIDIANTGLLKIQCKKLANYAPLNRIEEVQCHPEFGDIPVLITAGDNKRPIAAIYLDDFLWMVEQLQDKLK